MTRFLKLYTMTVRYVIFCALLFIAVEVSAATIMKEGTFYSDSFEGGTTANGEIFHQDGFTAAACDIPLGRNVYVSSESTGVVLHINDRPNCNRYPNVLDLTRRAFTLFAPETTGRIPSLSVNTLDTFREDRFSSLGILLNRALPRVYFAGESIGFEGHVTDKKSHVILFLQNQETKEEISRLFDVDTT